MNSLIGPFGIIGLVRFIGCTVIDPRCFQTVTSMVPAPSTLSGRDSFAAQSTAFRKRLEW